MKSLAITLAEHQTGASRAGSSALSKAAINYVLRKTANEAFRAVRQEPAP